MVLVTFLILLLSIKTNHTLIFYKNQERENETKPCSFLMILLATPLLKHTTFAHTNLHLR